MNTCHCCGRPSTRLPGMLCEACSGPVASWPASLQRVYAQAMREHEQMEKAIEDSLPAEASKAAFRIGAGEHQPGDIAKAFEGEP